MADKLSHQQQSKNSGKTLKEKRSERRSGGATTRDEEGQGGIQAPAEVNGTASPAGRVRSSTVGGSL